MDCEMLDFYSNPDSEGVPSIGLPSLMTKCSSDDNEMTSFPCFYKVQEEEDKSCNFCEGLPSAFPSKS